MTSCFQLCCFNNYVKKPQVTKHQCQINHMAEAAYATGPTFLWTPRLLVNFLFPVSVRGPTKHNAQQVYTFRYYLSYDIADTHCVTCKYTSNFSTRRIQKDMFMFLNLSEFSV
jgi:hypothetical protein